MIQINETEERKIVMQTKKIPNISGLVKETDYNAKITEIENKIPSINGLATTATLTAIENKIPDISNLVKRPNYDTKILDIESKHITTADYNKFAKNLVASNIESKELVDKSVIGGFISSAYLDKKKAVTLATKAEPKAEQDKIIKLQAFDSNYFRGKNHFEDDGNQKYLVFQPMYRYFKNIGNTDYISSWKYKGLSDEIIKPSTISNNSLSPMLSYIGNKTRVKFDGDCLKQDKITFLHGKTVNIYIVYEINLWNHADSSDHTLGNSLFGAVKLVKNADIGKCKYSGYGILFDVRGTFSFPTGGFGKNVIIFGVDMSSSVHVDNKKRHFDSWRRSKQELDNTTLTAEKAYSIKFIVTRKNFCFSLLYNGANSYLFVNGFEIH